MVSGTIYNTTDLVSVSGTVSNRAEQFAYELLCFFICLETAQFAYFDFFWALNAIFSSPFSPANSTSLFGRTFLFLNWSFLFFIFFHHPNSYFLKDATYYKYPSKEIGEVFVSYQHPRF